LNNTDIDCTVTEGRDECTFTFNGKTTTNVTIGSWSAPQCPTGENTSTTTQTWKGNNLCSNSPTNLIPVSVAIVSPDFTLTTLYHNYQPNVKVDSSLLTPPANCTFGNRSRSPIHDLLTIAMMARSKKL